MMHKTPAIVLGHSPYSESTLLVRLLTRELGVVRAMAKGARRKERRDQACWEPLAHIDVLLSLSGPDALGNVIEASPRTEGWPWLRRDLDRFAFAALGVEVLGAVAGLHPPSPLYYVAGERYLDRLGGAVAPGSLTIALLLGLLDEAGFPLRFADPDWSPETLPERLAWDETLSLLREAEPLEPATIPRPAAVALLELLRASDGGAAEPRIPPSAGRPLLRWLVRVWETHLRRPLASAHFLEKMVLDQSLSNNATKRR